MSQGTVDARRPHVLDDAFVEDLVGLSHEELRERHDTATAEQEAVSYLRRLVQGRLDLLRAGRDLRKDHVHGRGDAQLVAALARALSTPPDALETPAVRPDVASEGYAQALRAGEVVLADIRLSDPARVAEGTIDGLSSLEQVLSAARHRMFGVVAALRSEVDRRVAEGLLAGDDVHSWSGPRA